MKIHWVRSQTVVLFHSFTPISELRNIQNLILQDSQRSDDINFGIGLWTQTLDSDLDLDCDKVESNAS